MRNLIHKILKSLNINGRDWAILLPALLLAFSIWMIHNLSLKYNDYLKVYVIAKCEIPGHADISANRCEVIARCRATGYKMIRSAIKSGKSINVIFKPSDIRHKEGDMFYVISSDLIEYASHMYGADVTVDHFMTDTLFFRFPYENYKKVPVVPIYSLKYREQYMADSDIVVEPDSVLVYGEPYHLENVDAVYTKPIRYYDIAEDIRGVVGLEKIKGARVSEDEVSYSIDVKRFVEITSMMSIKVINVPSDKIVSLFPSVAEVSVRCNFPLVDNPLQGLSIEADYNELQKSIGGKCMLKPSGLSRGVISCVVDPVAVSCVIEDK